MVYISLFVVRLKSTQNLEKYIFIELTNNAECGGARFIRRLLNRQPITIALSTNYTMIRLFPSCSR